MDDHNNHAVKIVKVKLFSIQGLTREKTLKTERLIDTNVILYVPETQHKVDKILLSEGIESHINMKDGKDRRGTLMTFNKEIPK